MYKTPTDPKAFDKHYSETHISIAKRLPGLRKYEISQGPVMTPGGPSSYHMVATLRFNDMAAIQQAFARQQEWPSIGERGRVAAQAFDIPEVVAQYVALLRELHAQRNGERK